MLIEGCEERQQMKQYTEIMKADQMQPLEVFSEELKEKLWLKPSSIIPPVT